MAEREIKTVLTLDDASFTRGLKAATSHVSAARAEMSAAVKNASGLGKGLKSWSAQVSGLNKVLKAQKTQMGVLNREYQKQKKALADAQKEMAKARREHGAGSAEAKKAANAYAALSANVDDLRVKMARLSEQQSADRTRLRETLERPLQAVGTAAKGMGIAVATAMGLAGAALVTLGKKSLDARQQLNADLSASQATFGEWSHFIEQEADRAWENLGLSKDAYLQEAVTIGEYLQAAGATEQESASLTEQALQRAADLAGMYGTSTSEALSAIELAARGSYRQMNRFGVKLTTTAIADWALRKGLIKTKDELTNENAALFALQMILDQTQDAQDGFKTRTDNINSALETFNAAWQNFLDGSGSAGEVVTAFSGVATAFADEILKLAPELTNGLTDLISTFVDELPTTIEQLTPAAGTLLDSILDTITGNAEDIGTAAGTLAGTLAGDLVLNAPKLIAAAIQMVKSFLSGLLLAFDLQWKTKIYPAIQDFFKVYLGIELPDWTEITDAISAGWDTITAGIGDLFRVIFGVDPPESWDDVLQMLGEGWQTIRNAAGKLFRAVFKVDPPKSWDEVREMLARGWATIAGAVGDLFKAVFGVDPPESWDDVLTMIGTGWQTIRNAAGKLFHAVFKVDPPQSWDEVRQMLARGWATIAGAVGELFKAVFGVDPPESWDDVLTMIGTGWQTIRNAAGKILRVVVGIDPPPSWDDVRKTLSTGWDTIKTRVGAIFKVIFGIDPPKTWEEVWQTLNTWWQGVKENFNNIFELIVGVSPDEAGQQFLTNVGNALTNIKSALNKAVPGLSNLLNLIAGYTAYQAGLKFFQNLSSAFTTAKSALAAGVSSLKTLFSSFDWKAAAFSVAFAAIMGIIENWDTISAGFNDVVAGIGEFFEKFGEAWNAFWHNVYEGLPQWFKDFLGLFGIGESVVTKTPTLTVNANAMFKRSQLEELNEKLGTYEKQLNRGVITPDQIDQLIDPADWQRLLGIDRPSTIEEYAAAKAALADMLAELDAVLEDSGAEESAESLAGAMDTATSAATKFANALQNTVADGGISNAGGVWSVPFDNYLSALHRGEMVLTADQARRYRALAAGGGVTYNDSASIYIDKYNQYSGADASALLQQMQTMQRRQRMGYGMA